MILWFSLKLLFWNLAHSFLMGHLQLVVSLPALLISKLVGESILVERLMKFAVTGVMLLPIGVLSIVASEAVRLSLAADPDRIRWLWWLMVWLLAVQPYATTAVPPADEKEAGTLVVLKWGCRFVMLASVFHRWELPEWLQKLAGLLSC
jgi:hypothetical protein